MNSLLYAEVLQRLSEAMRNIVFAMVLIQQMEALGQIEPAAVRHIASRLSFADGSVEEVRATLERTEGVGGFFNALSVLNMQANAALARERQGLPPLGEDIADIHMKHLEGWVGEAKALAAMLAAPSVAA